VRTACRTLSTAEVGFSVRPLCSAQCHSLSLSTASRQVDAKLGLLRLTVPKRVATAAISAGGGDYSSVCEVGTSACEVGICEEGVCVLLFVVIGAFVDVFVVCGSARKGVEARARVENR
jgi:hypothetical protein